MLHIIDVIFKPSAAHARADNVDQGQHARLLAVDDVLFEILKVAPAGAARVDDSGHPIAEGEAVRPDP